MESKSFNVSEHVGEPLLFVGGDLSGIQKFLYNITSKKAAVSLKGRSKYLVDVMKDILSRLLKLDHVSQSEVRYTVYDSGGKFYLIIGDTPQNREDIDGFKPLIEKEMWNEHRGQLAINMAYYPFSFNTDETINSADGQRLPLGTLWRKVNEVFFTQKQQKFKSVIDEYYADFFGITEVYPEAGVCAISGIESSDLVKLDKDADGEAIYVLPSVKKQVEEGQKLRREQHFKTFEEYAGHSFLGILRMDVDGLGKMFINGFKTMASYQDFSNTLARFFNEELPRLQQSDEYSDYLNIIYAGGDDLFAVGRWDKLIDFARDVRNRFVQYVNRSGVTISGGIAIVNPKFPIAKAALLAGEAEEAAKHFRNGEKNAFCMFGQTISWNVEFDFVERYKKQMLELCQGDNMPKSILHKLMVMADIKRKGDVKYAWNTIYYLARFKRGKPDSVANFCDQLKIDLFDNSKRNNNFELIALAARWAEMHMKEVN